MRSWWKLVDTDHIRDKQPWWKLVDTDDKNKYEASFEWPQGGFMLVWRFEASRLH